MVLDLIRAPSHFEGALKREFQMRHVMFAALAISSMAFAGTCVAAETCDYRDYMPAYAEFYAQTQGQSPEQRGDAFVTQYAATHADYYWPELFGDGAKQRQRATRYFDPKLRPQFPGFPPLDDAQVLALAKTVGPQFASEQQRFAQTFPDFRCNSQVEFAPSLMKFDGHPDVHSGKNYLLFGVDMIALIHRPDDMPAFFDHELFHLYHDQVQGNETPQDSPGWWTMWHEGLATYVSQRMNPSLDAQHVLWFPADMVARMSHDEQRGAELLLADIDKTGADADRWFSAGKSVAGLPQRVGYYYGYLFAKKIGDNKPLAELARMKPEDIHVAEVSFLKSLADK
jgi:hypothetical protein